MEHIWVAPGGPQWNRWSELLAQANLGTVYHLASWIESIAAGLNQNIGVQLLMHDEKPLVGAPFRLGGRGCFTLAHKPWSTAYNCPVVANTADASALIQFREGLYRRFVQARLVYPPFSPQTEDFHAGNVNERRTPVLNVTAELWKTFDRRARQRVRKARDLNVYVTQSKDTDTFESLYRATYSRQNLRVGIAHGRIARALALAISRGPFELFVASTSNGEPAAALVVAEYCGQGTFVLGATHPRLRRTDANSLLWWETIQHLSKSCVIIDLVGEGTPEIARFKESFSPNYAAIRDVTLDSPSVGARLGRRLLSIGKCIRNWSAKGRTP